MKLLVTSCKFYYIKDHYFNSNVVAFAATLVLDNNSQNRDLKCNRICKLPVSSSCLGTFSLFYFVKLPIFSFFSILCPVMDTIK